MMKLFSFASAGSSASMYNELGKLLSEKVKLCSVEFSGHGKRFNEPIATNMNQVVCDCFSQIKDFLSEPYALMGYSMGAWVAYELYYQIIHQGYSPPSHIFICAQEPPTAEINVDNHIHTLPDDDFLQKIIELGGIPPELQNPEILSIFIPILKTDYQIVEMYSSTTNIRKEKIDCDISVIYSPEDRVVGYDSDERLKWKQCTSKEIYFHEIKGGHFFIYQHALELSRIIEQSLLNGLDLIDLE